MSNRKILYRRPFLSEIDADDCPFNFYCPKGSSIPRPCSPGTYQDELDQEQCKTCPAGSFCLETDTNADDSVDSINIIEPQLCALMIIVQAVVLRLYCVHMVLIQLT